MCIRDSGKADPYFVGESSEKTINDYRQQSFTVHEFEGAHDIDASALKEILNNF
jgi:hypothetical protein